MDEHQITPKEACYSQLTDTDISDEDYQHAMKVFESFTSGTMRIYHCLYMLSISLSFSSFSSYKLIYFSAFNIYIVNISLFSI